MTDIFDRYRGPKDVRKMAFADLEKFAKEIRRFLIEKVSKTGGHLASNLGVVELTLSLYKVFNFEHDKIVWDVGHQSYVHKILTGRREGFDNLRKYGGISGFPKREESPYDMFETGHSSTSISAALGMARARDLQKENYDVISVIGDGALTGGMAFEALNDVGYRKTKVIIILNDNQMSIASNVGGLSKYLSKIRLDPKYNRFKEGLDTKLRKIPSIGKGMANSIEKLKDSIKQLIVPGMLFEEMGIKYLGPIDGHNIKELTKVLSMAKNIKGPVLIHVITVKGKGYNHAEKNPGKFHGIGPFDCDSGEVCFDGGETYSRAFGEEMTRLAENNSNIVAITAAMRDGTGLKNFSQKFNDRFFDVGISEQHAVTLAAGMASEGLKPVFAVYSTFLQRAYDQVLHDVCIQNLPVILAIDRAGIVGEDGETHQGVFDLSFLSHMPNITIMSPKCVDELRTMLRWAVEEKYPIAIRYPRGGDNSKIELEPLQSFTKGKWEIIYGKMNNNNFKNKIAIIASGRMVQQSILAKEKIEKLNAEVLIVNACFIKPIDKKLIEELIANNYKIVTLEDNVVHGGFGSFVLEYSNSLDNENRVLCLGFVDKFIPHGSVELLYKLFRLDAEGIAESISKLLK